MVFFFVGLFLSPNHHMLVPMFPFFEVCGQGGPHWTILYLGATITFKISDLTLMDPALDVQLIKSFFVGMTNQFPLTNKFTCNS